MYLSQLRELNEFRDVPNVLSLFDHLSVVAPFSSTQDCIFVALIKAMFYQRFKLLHNVTEFEG